MSGPTRLGAAIAALIAVWVVAFWVTPASRGPRVSFGTSPRQVEPDQAITIVDPIPPRADLAVGTDAPTPEPAPDEVIPPAPTREAPTPVEPPSFFLYVIASGDTPESIARRFYSLPDQWSVVARANPDIDFGKSLPIGRVIRVPVDPGNVQGVPREPRPSPAIGDGDIEYVVREGDTLSAISLRFYGESHRWTLIRDANPGKINKDGTNIKPGLTIIIPKP